jgi:SAM-dependent methyltransferase
VRRVSAPSDHVAIVGAGTSALAGDLLAHGFGHIEAVDIAPAAVQRLLQRFGHDPRLHARVADVRTVRFDEPVDVWHDRATLHFLTGADDRAAYVDAAARAVRPGGSLVIATFAPDGPEQCSGLPVVRYDAPALAALFAGWFDLVESFVQTHATPWGSEQSFVHALLRRNDTEV